MGRNLDELREEIAPLQADLCSALAHPQRVAILCTLAEGPAHVSQLAERLGMSQPTASRHLKLLREQGIVSAKREGVKVFYEVADQRLISALDLMRAVLRERLSHHASVLEARDTVAAKSQS